MNPNERTKLTLASTDTVVPVKDVRKEKTVKKGWSKTPFGSRYHSRAGRYNAFQANDNDAFVPEMWAVEAVENMYENFLFANLVNRDFENQIQEFGDTVNTRKKSTFKAYRKGADGEAKTKQDASATNIPIILNQWVHVTIELGAKERSLSFQDLTSQYLPEMIAGKMRFVDKSIAGQAIQFRDQAVGGLGTVSNTNLNSRMVALRKVFNDVNMPDMGRNLGLANNSESVAQEVDMFKNRDYNGNAGGEALRRSVLGTLHLFDTFRSPNLPSVDASVVTMDGAAATTTAAIVPAGSTTFDVASASGLVAGQYIQVAGDDTPLRITNISTNTLTVAKATKNAAASGAAVTAPATGLVNFASGYAVGYAKGIEYDAGDVNVGQIVAFGDGSNTEEYVVIQVEGTQFWVDRPLESAVADNALICLGPAGDLNFGFHKDAITVVNRPLILAPSGTGIRDAVWSQDGISAKVQIGYNQNTDMLEIDIQSLFGVKTIDPLKGGLLYG